MSIDIKAPTFPESVADGTVATWHKKEGEAVTRDELLVDIETDKVVLEIVAPADGYIKSITKSEGDIVLSEELIGVFEEGEATASKPAAATEAPAANAEPSADSSGEILLSPAARKMAEENNLDPASIKASGKDGRVTKEDVVLHLKHAGSPPVASEQTPAPASAAPAAVAPQKFDVSEGERTEKRVPMTRLRATIARRLVEAQQTAAMLTTYNEVNMKPVMDLRKQYKDQFEKVHGTKLGFMSFFVKAATEALKRYPAVNASIDGNDMVYHGYQDVGVAVSTPKGLVVPILRDTDAMNLATIESTIVDFGVRARDGKLGIDEMQGGTFTISNGGVFGSLMSTPILNPPQTAIMGMHKIQERPMAVNGEVVILPMMYLALSYDHRMIDGKEAVQFLVTIKDLLEDPARILLDV